MTIKVYVSVSNTHKYPAVLAAQLLVALALKVSTRLMMGSFDSESSERVDDLTYCPVRGRKVYSGNYAFAERLIR